MTALPRGAVSDDLYEGCKVTFVRLAARQSPVAASTPRAARRFVTRCAPRSEGWQSNRPRLKFLQTLQQAINRMPKVGDFT